MMTTSSTSSARDIIRSPFTPSQWQELEHQALIFKYMVSGVPVPSELIYSVKRSLDSSLASRLFPHQPIGWGCFQVGFGRKADPEPGRCRRTDGKKWRCSKEAYPDSKYCERHMHRGRNRSRKPVEITSSSSSTSSTTSTTTATLISSTSPNTSSSLLNRSNLSINNNNITTTTTTTPQLSTDIYNTHQDPTQKSTFFNPFLYPQKTYVSTGFSSPHDHNTTHQLFLDSGSCSDKDYRYFHGTKEGVVDERDFFPEASGSVRGIIHQHDSCQPLMTNCFKGYSHDQSQFHQSFSDNSKPPQQQQQPQQHCFVLGTDFKSSSSANPLKIEKEEPDDTQKQLHHFFGEWPPKNTDSWLDLASNSRVHN